MISTRFLGKGLPLGIKAVLGGLALMTAATSVVEAQYYPPPPGYYRPAPPPGYYRETPPPGYYRPRPRYQDDGYVVAPRRRAYSSVCVTSRGSCSVGQMVPVQSGCVCHIPGFGKKRGAVQ